VYSVQNCRGSQSASPNTTLEQALVERLRDALAVSECRRRTIPLDHPADHSTIATDVVIASRQMRAVLIGKSRHD